MRATNPKDAEKEGRRVGDLLRSVGAALAAGEPAPFEPASKLAFYVAVEILGYRDAEMGNGYATGLTAALTNTKTPEQLQEEYAAGNMPLAKLNKLLAAAVKAEAEGTLIDEP